MPAANPPVVLQVLPALQAGGVERGTIEMVQAIVAAGGRAVVASAGGVLTPRVERAGGTHITLPLASKNPLTMALNARRLATAIRAHEVHLVHARSRAPAWSAWRAARTTGTRFVTTWHGSYTENLPGKRRYNAVMARGDRVIAISHHIAAELMRRHAVPADRVRVIPRGVDPAIFDPQAVSGDRLVRLAAQWRVLDGQPILLLPARMTRWKGHAVAIAALARMADPTTCLVLAGAEGTHARYVAELGRLAVQHGVGGRVRLVGDCADMPAALKLADVVLNTSIVPEAFGRTVIEAQAMARLLVAADHGGAAETVQDGVTGFLVPPNDPAALAALLDRLLPMPAAGRAMLGEAARAAVCARYTTAAMQRATLDVYDELLGG